MPTRFPYLKVLCLGVLTSLAACSDGTDGSRSPAVPDPEPPPVEPTLDEQLGQVISEQELTGDPSTGRDLPSISDPLAQLGMKLFFSKSLSGPLDTACVSCHHPTMGGGDDLPLPIGVEAEFPDLLGPDRVHASWGHHFDGGPTVPRNAPTTFNIALWDQVLFHDGRVESLGKTAGANGNDGQGIRTPDSAFGSAAPDAENLTQAQALFPVTSVEEMRGQFVAGGSNAELRAALTERLVSQEIANTWLADFQAAFDSVAGGDELITYQNISRALAAYENSQVFVDTPWKAYIQGDTDAISDSAKRGAILFHTSVEDGGASCDTCHSGDFYSDEQFHVLAIPQIGRGKGDGATGDDDFGRFRETGVPDDRYAFRTPTLLNVAVTGPWGHSGAYLDLAAIVRHHVAVEDALDVFDYSLGGAQAGIQYDNAQANTMLALEQLRAQWQSGTSLLTQVELSDEQIDDLVSFLHALTDPCVEDRACIGKWVPENVPGPDALQLNATNAAGDLL